MAEFMHMGGYAGYVWSAYGITLAVLLLNVWSARARRIGALERARTLAARERPDKLPTVTQLP